MHPDHGPPDQEVAVRVSGERFRPALYRNASCSGPTLEMDDAFMASLDSHPLGAVTWSNTEELSCVVPSGLAPGKYDLIVTDPLGRTAQLPEAYEVVAASDSDIDTDTDTDVDSDTDIDTDTDTDSDTDTDTDTETECVPDSEWWNTDWSFRRQLTFDNSGQAETLQSFPVLVVLDDSNFDYAEAEPDGIDLRFIDDDGATELAYHIEDWNAAGQSFVWVRVTDIDGSSAADHVFVYYGNPSAPDVQDESGTYDATYAGVWHLSESSGTHYDSTSNNTDCVWGGGGDGTQDAIGQIAGADQFDGSVDMVDCGSDVIPDNDYHTITTWVNLDLSGGSQHYEIVCGESTSNPYSGIGLYVHRLTGTIGKWLSGSVHYSTVNAALEGEWTFLSVRGFRDAAAGYIEISKNGSAWESVFAGDTTNLTIVGGAVIVFGRWPGGGPGYNTAGIIDEVRISAVARSEDWNRAQYLSMSDSFITYGPAVVPCP